MRQSGRIVYDNQVEINKMAEQLWQARRKMCQSEFQHQVAKWASRLWQPSGTKWQSEWTLTTKWAKVAELAMTTTTWDKMDLVNSDNHVGKNGGVIFCGEHVDKHGGVISWDTWGKWRYYLWKPRGYKMTVLSRGQSWKTEKWKKNWTIIPFFFQFKEASSHLIARVFHLPKCLKSKLNRFTPTVGTELEKCRPSC